MIQQLLEVLQSTLLEFLEVQRVNLLLEEFANLY